MDEPNVITISTYTLVLNFEGLWYSFNKDLDRFLFFFLFITGAKCPPEKFQWYLIYDIVYYFYIF